MKKMKQSLFALTIVAALSITFISCSKDEYIIEEEKTPGEIEFTGEVASCGSSCTVVYRVTADAEEKGIEIQGDLNNFNNNEAFVTVTGANLTVTQSNTAANFIRNIKLEGNLIAGQEAIITITWISTRADDTISSDWTLRNAEGLDLAAPVAALMCEPR